MVENVGVAVELCLYVAANASHIYQQKYSIFPGRVPLVFQLAPGTGKSYFHAGNVRTSGIGPAWNRFLTAFQNLHGSQKYRKKT